LVLAIVLIFLSSLASPTQAIGTDQCIKVLALPQNGIDAINNLKDKLGQVAALNGKSEAALKQLLLSDSSVWLDECGLAFYVDEVPSKISSSSSPLIAPYPYDQTFLLNSKPGSTKTIYLDFNGHTISGTAWNSYFGVSSPYFASGYSQDADFSTFTNQEMDVIQSVWQRVSEDFAPFDVNVTTQQPAPGIIERDNLSDNVFGTRAVVSADSAMQTKCGCGGVAYLGVFDNTGTSHSNYQPAWVFTKGVGNGAKNITEALSHEVGHNVGLNHDGTSTQGYYTGSAGWAPIMGVGYYEGLTQWSSGEYPNANNRENDYTVIANNGVPFRTDEDSNNSISARPLIGSSVGVISTPTDTDWYTFTPSSSGSATISGTVASVSPNLDLRIDLYVSSDLTTPIASSNPAMIDVSTDFVDGLNAAITYSVTAGLTYFIKVDGVGFGDLYSDYGSLGNYTIQLSGVNSSYLVSSASFSPNSTSVPFGYLESSTSSTLTLTRSGTSGSNPEAVVTVNSGNWNITSPSSISTTQNSLSSSSGATLTLTSSSGSAVISLAAGSPAGTYTATVTAGTTVIGTYSVIVTTPYNISSANASPTSSTVPTTYSSSATQTTITLTRSGTSGSNPTTTLAASGGTWSLAGANNVTLSSASLTTGTVTVTLLSASGSFTLSLNPAAPIGIYRATLGTSLLSYSVNVGQVPNQVTDLTCQKNTSKRNSGICSWSALTPTPTRYEYRSKPSTSTTWTNWTSTSTNNSLTLNGLKSRVTYNVEVRAVNQYGPGLSATTSLTN